MTGVAVAGMVGASLALPASAVHDEGLFELDANVLDQAAAGDDWSNIFAGTDSAFTDTGIVADPAPQSIFTGGGSKDDLDIPSWKHKNGSVPDKDDITNAYAAAYASGGDTFVYFGLDRFAVQGSSDVGFWFFQDDVAPIPGTPPGSTSSFSGQHEVGDLLVLSEFDEGGGGITIKVFEWVGTGGDEGSGTLQTLFGGDTGLPADCDAVAAGDDVCANVNTSPIPDADIPWDYVGKGGTRNMPTGSFFEGGINLDAFFEETPCFSNVVAETRSSFEVNAVLKDLVHSQFELCDANISIAPDDVNDVGDSHTFTVTANQTFAGQETPAPDGTIVTVTLTDQNGNPVTATTDTCATGTVGGTCSVTFSSNVAGVITGHAEADIAVGDTTIHVETGGTGNNPDAVKRFVDARISITPDDINGIGETHTFVVDVDKDLGDGNGFVAATEGDVDFTLTDAAGAVNEVDLAASTCDDAGDNLDASGQCTIVFTSNTAGTVTGHASVSLVITTDEGTVTLTRATDGAGGNTGDAVKEFVDGSLAWLKNDDQGNRLGGATFQVCRTHNLDTSTSPDTLVDIPDVCVDVLDNSAADADPDDGEFLLEDLILGGYTVKEVPPFPPGFEPDPDTVPVTLTLEPGPKDVTIAEAFVNRALFRLIVLTCNTSTEALVDSTVDLNGDVRETINAGQLPAGVSEEALCTLAGANYDNLTRGTYAPTVELPDEPPHFP
ncbi:MAG TPA: prealbumin-like fold domain-containing protein [Acidimicrobiales bacterium]|nr:prealbumin-like fold domain-containing protein [Acidimicrobiales bacterium]